jgi:hypothetical protein
LALEQTLGALLIKTHPNGRENTSSRNHHIDGWLLALGRHRVQPTSGRGNLHGFVCLSLDEVTA